MNNNIIKLFVSFLFCSLSTSLFAYDFAVDNAEGVTLYYNYINEGKDLEVTYKKLELNFDSYSGDIIIPEEVTFMGRTRKVIQIGREAFAGCPINSVMIPNSVTKICAGAFGAIGGLESISIPNSVTTIETQAFSECYDLASIKLPEGLKEIEIACFSRCEKLKSVTIPNSVTIIKQQAFEYCRNLENIEIGNGLVSIEPWAFYQCTSLTNVTFPNSVENIEYNAFYECSSLSSITLSNSISKIDAVAFWGCAITSLIIPNSVKSIGQGAFNGADMTFIVSQIENPFRIAGDTEYRTFSRNTYKNATLYVPVGTKEKYMATEGWKDFLFIEEGNGISNSVINESASNLMIQTDGKRVIVIGANDGTKIIVFGSDGVQVGSTISNNGKAIIDTKLPSGCVAIIQIGNESKKILIK